MSEVRNYELLPEEVSKVMQLLRKQALARLDVPLPNPYVMSNYELTTLLIREAGDAMLTNPMNLSRDVYDKRLYPLWNALRARLDGKQPPFLPGDTVIVKDVTRSLHSFDYPELRRDDEFLVTQIFYRFEIDSPYDPDWTVYISKDGKSPPSGSSHGGWCHYNTAFFEKKLCIAA